MIKNFKTGEAFSVIGKPIKLNRETKNNLCVRKNVDGTIGIRQICYYTICSDLCTDEEFIVYYSYNKMPIKIEPIQKTKTK